MKERIAYVQRMLSQRGRDPGVADGIIGDKTRKALDSVIGLPKKWNDNRKVIGCIQLLAMEQGMEIHPYDGYWGPQTEYAFENLKELAATGSIPGNWRESETITGNEAVTTNPHRWPVEEESELIKFYGPVGQNQTRIQLPYPHLLAWQTDKVIHNFSCHEKVHDSLLRVLNRVLSHYGPEQIRTLGLDLFGGCLNVRKIRGGDRYSTHSWGIAVDYDPDQNQLRWGRDKARLAKPEYEQWWQFWEEEGWVSLGRLKNYDWMHVQAARR